MGPEPLVKKSVITDSSVILHRVIYYTVMYATYPDYRLDNVNGSEGHVSDALHNVQQAST